MPSKTSLINRALRVFAGRQITSPEDGSIEARVCVAAWPDALDAVLAAGDWAHAQVWASLGRIDNDPAFGHSYAYRLPLDCVRVMDVRGLCPPRTGGALWGAPAPRDMDVRGLCPPRTQAIPVRGAGGVLSLPPADYALVGQDVYTDVAPCFARYIARREDTALWPAPFCDAFSLRLAMEVAPVLSTDAGLGLKLRQTYYETLDMARLADAAQSKPPDMDQAATCDLLAARD